MKFRFSLQLWIFYMKTLFLTIFVSTLPFSAYVAFQEARSVYNVAQIERVHNLPVNITIPSNEIEVEFVPFFEEPRNVVCGEYTCTFTPSSDFVADSE